MVMVPIETCNEAVRCVEVPGRGWYRKSDWFPADEMASRIYSRQQIVTFSIKNNSDKDYYLYLLDIAPDGSILIVFPKAGLNDEAALISSGKSLNLLQEDYALLLDTAGEETVKVIASLEPIRVELLEQAAYKSRGANSMNPLEKLLSSALGGQRGQSISIRPATWGVQQITLKVVDGSQ